MAGYVNDDDSTVNSADEWYRMRPESEAAAKNAEESAKKHCQVGCNFIPPPSAEIGRTWGTRPRTADVVVGIFHAHSFADECKGDVATADPCSGTADSAHHNAALRKPSLSSWDGWPYRSHAPCAGTRFRRRRHA